MGGEGGAVFSVQGSYRAKRGAHRTGQLGGSETGALGEPCVQSEIKASPPKLCKPVYLSLHI